MSESNTHHIGDAIRELLKQYHLASKFDETNLITSWERLMGKPVARHTRKVFVRDKVLFIQLDSPTLKHDLTLHKAQILEVFTKEFGQGTIKDIVLM